MDVRRTPLTALVLGAVVLVAGCASSGGGPTERAQVRLELFERHAGPAVADFRFWRMDRWETLGRDVLAVWTKPDEAWLIRVREPCNGLEYAQVLGLSSTLNRVHRVHDEVRFEQQRCRIEEIRPVDGRALKAEQRAIRAEG